MTPDPPRQRPEGAFLVTVSGLDRPGSAADLFAALEQAGADVLDVEQVTIFGQLLLAVVVVGVDQGVLQDAVAPLTPTWGLAVAVNPTDLGASPPPHHHHWLTVLAPTLPAAALAGVFGAVARAGGNVERIVQLAHQPVVSYELLVAGAGSDELRRQVAQEAARLRIDVAVQRAGLHRRARHLIVLDVDSTLIRQEVVDLLAERAGCAQQVAEITRAAMAGELEFAEALRARVQLLAGLPASTLEEVRQSLELTPGARTLVRTLARLGYETAVVSGGFLQVIEPMAADLGIRRVAANRLEVADGRLTGRLLGPIVDRAGKAEALRRFAAEAGVPLAQTVAVGDGANDIDMLSVAGLGIAFNAKAVVQDAADAALNVPYLDPILYLLGVPRSEIEAADEPERPEGVSARTSASLGSA
ncbi:phosphoserine phosphatase SerB [Aciditerrimonas ferrireducens]|uniref:phosphoserine phosphatase SerB n=1 Tax=Aciditerrimonas ferrireducens TaxID=667306 RepID=UPI0020047DD8|nr:phosphoserine phosphatase SerB [Aciditerrimonas ferrireducens]MCK4176960.1 phosphoserine phosphatase SerB [Aciditerrimonas ferrireducens]